jgi:hypothetical protein
MPGIHEHRTVQNRLCPGSWFPGSLATHSRRSASAFFPRRTVAEGRLCPGMTAGDESRTTQTDSVLHEFATKFVAMSACAVPSRRRTAGFQPRAGSNEFVDAALQLRILMYQRDRAPRNDGEADFREIRRRRGAGTRDDRASDDDGSAPRHNGAGKDDEQELPDDPRIRGPIGRRATDMRTRTKARPATPARPRRLGRPTDFSMILRAV